jgi:parallel beta-helix repeat protein
MKSVQRLSGALFVAGCVCSGSVAQAATYYVATNGSDGRSCSQATSQSTPKRTLNNAVGCLRAGDTLYVRGGVYDESLLANISTVPSGTSWSNKVAIAAYPDETVTMRPSSGSFVLQFAGSNNSGQTGGQQYIEFDGINLDGTNVVYDVVKIEAGPGYNAHHIRIKNATLTAVAQNRGNASQIVLITGLRSDAIGFNEFQHVTLTGGAPVTVGNDFSSMFYVQTPDNLIEDSIIENGIGAGVQIYNGNAPGSVPDRTIVRNNIIRHFNTSLLTRAYGIIAAGGSSHQIYNNLIYDIANVGGVSGGIYLYNASNSAVYNNTVYGNALYGIMVETYTSGASVRNNISYRNGVTNYVNYGSGTFSSNNLTTDPGFVNASGDDFTLRSGSPAIDAGAYLAEVQSDQLGVPRPQGNAYDIGAFEYNQGGGAAAPAPPPAQPTQPAQPPAQGASPDSTRTSGSSPVVDNSLAAWTVGSGLEILRNGVQMAAAYGSQILWYQGSIFVLGDDSLWWRWNGSWFTFYSANDPNGGASAAQSVSSGDGAVATTASPSGTRVPGASSIVDNSLAVWTLVGQEILRNGARIGGGAFGSQILWYQGVIYVRGDDSFWWRWNGSFFAFYGSNAPV